MFMQTLEILTIGLPFCAFKCLAGLYLQQYWLVALGVVDLGINLWNLMFLFLKRRRAFDACFFSFLVCFLKRPTRETEIYWKDFGNSVDVIVSFAIVAFIIGAGHIQQLPQSSLQLWNIAVILNVIGAGSSRLTASLQNLREKT